MLCIVEYLLLTQLAFCINAILLGGPPTHRRSNHREGISSLMPQGAYLDEHANSMTKFLRSGSELTAHGHNLSLTNLRPSEIPDLDGEWVMDAGQIFFYDGDGHEKSASEFANKNFNSLLAWLFSQAVSLFSVDHRTIQDRDRVFESAEYHGLPDRLAVWVPPVIKRWLSFQVEFTLPARGIEKQVFDPPRKIQVDDDRIPRIPGRQQILASDEILRSDAITSSWIAWMDGSSASKYGVGCKRCYQAKSLVLASQETGAGTEGMVFRYRVGSQLHIEDYISETGWTLMRKFRRL